MWGKIRLFFISLNTASILLLLLTIFSLLAGFFPQFPRDSIKNPSEAQWWWNAARERYGIFFPILKATGLFTIFYSPVFWVLLILILIGVLFCSWTQLPRGFHVPRLSSILAHSGLLLLAIGLTLSGFLRYTIDSPPLPPGGRFDLNRTSFTISRVWVERSPEGAPLAFGCEGKIEGKILKLSPGWPALAEGFWILPLSYGPAWKIRATGPAGEALRLTWKEEAEGELIIPFARLGEMQEIIIPDADARLEISVQTRGTFVDFYEKGKLAQRMIIQEETEIKGERVRLQFSPEHYIVLRVVKDPGFWPAMAGAVVIAVGFGIAFLTTRKVST
ncbi:MAG: hypothetical protein RMK30_05615 [Anaerolineae bacterium]|nr:hypothetical protein [Anaerolineae bacterium]MDW8102335.1 hypothetical protein [Anaerolineae bacterium]